jgi:hypothetical protein
MIQIRRAIGRATRTVTGLKRLMAWRDHYRGIEVEYLRLKSRIRYEPGHFYSPQPDPGEYAACADPMAAMPLDPATLLGLDLNRLEQLATLERLKPFYNEQPFGSHPLPGLRYYFGNTYFSFADALSLYGLMRLYRPSQIIEV